MNGIVIYHLDDMSIQIQEGQTNKCIFDFNISQQIHLIAL